MRSQAPLRLLSKIARRTPDLLPTIARGLFHKHLRGDLDYLRADGRASAAPSMITLRVTGACNHRCAVCGQHGAQGYARAQEGRKHAGILPIEPYERLIDEVAPHRPVINVTGGEPFLYPDLMRLCGHVKRRGLPLFVTTNGVRLARCADEIVAQGWDVVLVSLDGPEAIHDACRGTPGAFRAAVTGLEALREARERRRASRPYVNTSTTLSRANVAALEETFALGERLRPDLMVLYLSWFTDESIGREQSAILARELGVEAYTWRSYVQSFTPAEAEAFRAALIRLKARPWPFEHLIVPDVGDEAYADYYLRPRETFGFSKCTAPFLMTDVMPNGDVVTCRDFIDVKVGNVTERPLLEIWNDAPYVAYRQLMRRHGGMLPQCSRCCGLMGF
jgi:radical SAM protein with 4Fe4S-binding SPASM domain